jgi:hypothetical protein
VGRIVLVADYPRLHQNVLVAKGEQHPRRVLDNFTTTVDNSGGGLAISYKK